MKSFEMLPEGFTSVFWLSAAQETGAYSLNMILLRAGLGNLVEAENNLPKRVPISPEDFVLFNRSMREYYGKGARGILIRTGRGAGHLMVKHLSLSCRLLVNWCHFLPKTWRARRAINHLANQLSYPGGGIVVTQADDEILVTDLGSLACRGEIAPEPICFTTIGLLRGVVETVTGEELDVEEESCTATGGKTCQFRIKFLNGRTLRH